MCLYLFITSNPASTYVCVYVHIGMYDFFCGCRKNENLRKVHHILLVYAMFNPGRYIIDTVYSCV